MLQNAAAIIGKVRYYVYHRSVSGGGAKSEGWFNSRIERTVPDALLTWVRISPHLVCARVKRLAVS